MKKTKFTLVFVSLVAIGCNGNNLETQYKQAILNSMETKVENIRNLVNIDPNNKDVSNVKWSDDGEEVLMTTFHRFPDSYPEGVEIELSWGDAWVTSAKEFSNFYKRNKDEFNSNPALRIKQMLGLSYTSANTYITSYWVDTDDLIRPAYVTDITKPMKTTFDDDVGEDYKNWFNNYYNTAYWSDSPMPWTRLGYTYDWKAGEDRYGLSEFLIQKQNPAVKVTVEKTAPVTEFLSYLENL